MLAVTLLDLRAALDLRLLQTSSSTHKTNMQCIGASLILYQVNLILDEDAVWSLTQEYESGVLCS